MAVAVLEKNVESTEQNVRQDSQANKVYNVRMTADEKHNAQISERYAKLINPSARVEEVLGRSVQEAQPVKDIFAGKPYLVENARADAAIFRADSPINRGAADRLSTAMNSADQDSEDEDEDLRPTPTTIQYKTYGSIKKPELTETENISAEKHTNFGKKEKIIIGVVAAVIIAMFILIIVNSAILSGINSDVGSLQSSLVAVKSSYSNISSEVDEYKELAIKNIDVWAILKGLIK